MDDVKLKILNYSREKFLKNGFQNVSLDDIASDLHISKKTIYKYFKSKKELYCFSIRELLNEIKNNFNIVLFSENYDFIAKIEKIVEIITKKIFFNINKDFLKDMQNNIPEMWIEIENFRKENIYKNLFLILNEGINKGTFRNDIDPIFFINIFFNTINNFVNPKFILENNFSPQYVIKSIFKIFFEGILTEEGKKEFSNKIVLLNNEKI